MAVCATAATRLSGELPPRIASVIKIRNNSSLSGIFYTACINALPVLHTDEVEFNFMRTEALLGMLCLEYNNIRGCHAHLHRYLAMCAEIGFNDESKWPPGLTAIEVEERRRLVRKTLDQLRYASLDCRRYSDLTRDDSFGNNTTLMSTLPQYSVPASASAARHNARSYIRLRCMTIAILGRPMSISEGTITCLLFEDGTL